MTMMTRSSPSNGSGNDEKKKKKKETTTTHNARIKAIETTLVTPKSIRLSKMAPRCDTPFEYNTDPIIRKMTRMTRLLSTKIPLSIQHKFRDSGGFKLLADTIVTTIAVPTAAISNPNTVIKEFISLTTKNCQRLYYGIENNTTTTTTQFIDVFFPKVKVKVKRRGMIFFVHGGAWGSGQPWFYRLIAKSFLELGFAVAIIGYRVYPLCGVPPSNSNNNNNNTSSSDRDRGGILTQVDDLELAFCKLVKEYPEWCCCFPNQNQNHDLHLPHHLGTIVMGHSSGAHISLLWLVERAKQQLQQQQQRFDDDANNKNKDSKIITSFIGISGVYNINHHFDYESGRGVEEISPLKPVCGYNRKSFNTYTPTFVLQNELLLLLSQKLYEQDESLLLSSCFPNRMLLVHGIEDDIVPFTSTGEAAKILRQCLGGSRSTDSASSTAASSSNIIIDEYYVPKTGHQDTIVDLMMLKGKDHPGPVTKNIIEWLLKQPTTQKQQLTPTSTSIPTPVTVTVTGRRHRHCTSSATVATTLPRSKL